MNENEITIRSYDGKIWICDNGWFYTRDKSGIFIPVKTAPLKQKWHQKLFK